MTRGEGHSRSTKKPSGKEKGSAKTREDKSSGKGAAAEDRAGGARVAKLSLSEFKRLILSEGCQLPNFNVNKDEENIDCCYAYYKAYADSLDENMGGDVISLLDCVQRLVESMDEITNPGHNYLRWASALLKPFIGRQADDLHRELGISELSVVLYTFMNQLETNNLMKKFAPREIKNEMLKLIEIISASPSVYAYGEPNHRLTNDLKEEDDGLQYAINDKSYPTVIQLGKMLRSQAGLSLSGDGENRAKESEHDLAPNASEGEEEEEEAEPKEDDDASHESQSVVSSTSLVSVQQEATSWAKAIQQALIKKN